MAKQKKRKQKKSSRKSAGATSTFTLSHDLHTNRRLIKAKVREGKTKMAVDMAKAAHQAFDSPDSEILLVETYLARIERLIETGMGTEAQSLLEMIRSRYPDGWSACSRIFRETAIRTGSTNMLLDILVEPDRDDETQKLVLATLEACLSDPAEIADSPKLPSDHPLKRAAQAVKSALAAVATGPVDDAVIQLDEVSRRSPLAPWKLLVRAIAQFYRNNDEACLALLDRLPPNSAPTQFAPVLRGMIAGRLPANMSPGVEKLVAQTMGHEGGLKILFSPIDEMAPQWLKRMRGEDEDEFDDENDDDVDYDDDFETEFLGENSAYCKLILEALRRCKKDAPHLYSELKRRIIAQAYVYERLDSRFMEVIHESTPRDAQYWFKIATYYQNNRQRSNTMTDALYWQFYQLCALREGLFAPESMENRDILLHIARLKQDQHISPNKSREKHLLEIATFTQMDPEFIFAFHSLSEPDREEFLRSSHALYHEAMSIQPDRSVFEEWRRWAAGINAKLEQEVLDAWTKALPDDSQPLLYLARAAEERKAYTKALKYIEKAEERNRLDPKVQQGRLQLQLAIFGRHLDQRKPHLLERDIVNIESLPLLSRGDARALAPLLRWVYALMVEDSVAEAHAHEKMHEYLGDTCTVYCLIEVALYGWDVLPSLQKKLKTYHPVSMKKVEPEVLLKSLVRSGALIQTLGVPSYLLSVIMDRSLPRLKKASNLDSGALAAIGRLCVELNLYMHADEFLFWVSGALMTPKGRYLPEALAFRSMCRCDHDLWRVWNCLGAAAYYARSQGDSDVISFIAPLWDNLEPPTIFDAVFRDEVLLFMDAEHAELTLQHEQSCKSLDARVKGYDEDYHFIQKCTCSYCSHNKEVRKKSIRDYDFYRPKRAGRRPSSFDGDDSQRPFQEELF